MNTAEFTCSRRSQHPPPNTAGGRHFEMSDDVIHGHVSSCDHVTYFEYWLWRNMWSRELPWSRARNVIIILIVIHDPVVTFQSTFMPTHWKLYCVLSPKTFHNQHFQIMVIIMLFPCTTQGASQPLIFWSTFGIHSVLVLHSEFIQCAVLHS